MAHASRLGEQAEAWRSQWEESAEKKHNPGRPPERKEKRKKKKQNKGKKEEGKRPRRTDAVLATKYKHRRCTGKPTLREGDLTWREFFQISFGSETPHHKTKTRHKTTTNNRKPKFAPENLFQTATLRKGDLTWREFFKSVSGAKHHTIKQKPRQNNAQKNTRPQQTTERAKFAPENLFQTATLRKGDLTWREFFQISFRSETPHHKIKNLGKTPQKNTRPQKTTKRAKVRSR